ncbi:Chaperone J-domain superfamily [Sesbania bispinosa]|nr:Chaperone J-domain superfamily [Sesbania bispinosa]
MSRHQSKSEKKPNDEKQLQRDPYEVLGVSHNSIDQEIKISYKKMPPSEFPFLSS